MTKSIPSRASALMLGGLLAFSLEARAQQPSEASPDKISPGAGSSKASVSKKQSENQKAAQKPKAEVSSNAITVVAKAPGYKSSIDRRSYSITKDLTRGEGSLADVLRNIPSVDVDPQGSLSLRGSTSVTVLVDGQPSPLFQGAIRADTLQQLPADQFERVEVMTNPSAAFRPDGTGGIINLISKKVSSRQGANGTIKFSVGTNGRYSGSLSGTDVMGDVSVSGTVTLRRTATPFGNDVSGIISDPVTGHTASVKSDRTGSLRSDSASSQMSANYKFNKYNSATASLTFAQLDLRNKSDGSYTSGSEDPSLIHQYSTEYFSRSITQGAVAAISAVSRSDNPDDELSARLNISALKRRTDSSESDIFSVPAATDLFQALNFKNMTISEALKVELKRSAVNGAKLVTGLEINADQDSYDHSGNIGTAVDDALPLSGLANHFRVSQTVGAAYLTIDRSFGKFEIMPGIRVEETLVKTSRTSSEQATQNDYFEFYPTFHVGYDYSDHEKITGSYSRRVQRPDPESLNNYRVYQGPLSYSQGNIYLKPSITDSVELGYEWRHDKDYRQFSLFYRDNRNAFAEIMESLGGGAVLKTASNIGRSKNTGVEIVDSMSISPALTLNGSVDAIFNELEGFDGAGAHRSGYTVKAKLNLNWNPTKLDFLQLSGNWFGRQVTIQGAQAPMSIINVGYRHQFNNSISTVVTLQDPFGTFRPRSYVNSSGVQEASKGRAAIRAVIIGISYSFGASGKRSEGFDFGS